MKHRHKFHHVSIIIIVTITIIIIIMFNVISLTGFGMRRAIARARLCTHLKHWRHAKKSKPCLIKKASRCAADRTSKTTTFFTFTFCKTQKSYKKIMCIYLLFHWFSGENCIIRSSDRRCSI